MTENTPEEQLRLIDTLTDKLAVALQKETDKYRASEQARHELYSAEGEVTLLKKELSHAQQDLIELKINK